MYQNNADLAGSIPILAKPPQSLRVWAGRSGLEASRPALSIRQIKALDQGEEPEARCI
jgi:hypothetical protein